MRVCRAKMSLRCAEDKTYEDLYIDFIEMCRSNDFRERIFLGYHTTASIMCLSQPNNTN